MMSSTVRTRISQANLTPSGVELCSISDNNSNNSNSNFDNNNNSSSIGSNNSTTLLHSNHKKMKGIFVKSDSSNNGQDGTTTTTTASSTVPLDPFSPHSRNSSFDLATSKNGGTNTGNFIDRPKRKYTISWFAIQITMIASIGGILFGYDLGVISCALPQLTTNFNLSNKQQELAVSILYLGGGFGAMIGGSLCDSIGRKRTILLTDIIFCMGAILLFLAPSYDFIILGRIVLGFGVAISGIADVSYLHEIAPKQIRGAIVSVNEACISLGFLVAFCVGSYYSRDAQDGWRYMFGFSGIFAVLQFIGMLRLPESPKWLRECGRIEESEQALRIIKSKFVGGKTDDDSDNDDDYDEHQHQHQSNNNNNKSTTTSINQQYIPLSPSTAQRYQSISTEKSASFGSATDNDNNNNNNSLSSKKETQATPDEIILAENTTSSIIGRIQYYWRQVVLFCRQYVSFLKLCFTQYRRQTYITLFLVATQQFCGQTNVISYAPSILARVSSHNKQQVNNNDGTNSDGNSTLIIGLVKFVVTVLVIWKIEHYGRRTLLLTGMTTISIGLFLLVVAFANVSTSDDIAQEHSNDVLALPGVLLVVMGYSMSFGPLSWLLTSELYPTDVRGRALGASTIVTYLCASIVTNTFLSTQEIFGSSTVFASYMFITIVGIIFAAVAIPDTGGKDSDEISNDLDSMPWWKKSSRYDTQYTNEAFRIL